ncbi:MAG: diaminopimelate epimerase [Gammaproteobacteria bacterium]|nr:diaminopimelate epimerase [Gammaproteobacteria bacterium]NND38173.1 diaminopimelate epimerase [Pseudomonadales bacterium]MBT8151729.1 diaminopimelate epimerase [Gammaproteobacteria bacterium]NNL11734.1 diaminopimelate epimerase [Pseudomonadales bacterium]NNM11372.1 diaminopimelate epimerase [Pseudomonadales bacterium]
MQLRFTKMHGLGNDFVVIDTLSQDCSLSAEQIRRIADRKRGVGCDQLLLIEPPNQPDVDFFYRIYNADGSEVEQCGNGARCLGKYVSDKKITGKQSIRVNTINSAMRIDILGGNLVRVDMGLPNFEPDSVPFQAEQRSDVYNIEHEGGSVEASVLSMGNPHAVLQVDDVEAAPVAKLGPAIQHSARFGNGVNVGFMQVNSSNAIKLRVFERGAGETEACGSGACAAVVAGRVLGALDQDVEVELLGGKLRVHWAGEGEPVLMTGEAIKVFDGKMKL